MGKKRSKKGCKKATLLFDEEDAKLWKQLPYKKGQVRLSFLKKYFGLVLLVAQRYHQQGMDFLDLTEVGNIGLLKAIESYNPEYNIPFSHYAKLCIDREIKRFLVEKEMIKLPRNIATLSNKYKEAFSKLYKKYKRLPTLKEIAKVLKISEKRLEETLKLVLPTWKMQSIEAPVATDMDVETPLKGEDVIAPVNENFDEIITKKMLLKKAVSMLKPLSQRIIRWYYGLDGWPQLSLYKISRILKKTPESVRQLRDRAIKELKKKAIRLLGITET
jgi:DNA-directed RNA polymerase specialized sigma subunit